MTFSQLHPLAYPPIGRWLKAQRDVLGYSLSQASDKVQMSERTLQLLESESFLDLPEPVFVKGYLRRYAHQLKLNPQEVIALFDAWMVVHKQQNGTAAQALPSVQPSSKAPPFDAIRKGIAVYASDTCERLASAMNSRIGHTVVITVCVGLFSFFLSQGSGTTRANTVSHAAKPVAIRPQAFVAHIEIPPARALLAIDSPRKPINLESWLIASETTHVNVIDKRGLIIFRGLVRAGTPVRLKGSKPFDIQPAKEGTISLVSNRDLRGRHLSVATL